MIIHTPLDRGNLPLHISCSWVETHCETYGRLYNIKIFLGQFLVETENNNLAHEQERIRFKNQLQQASKFSFLDDNQFKIIHFKDNDNRNTTNSNGNIRQLEYELTEARFQIERLKSQIETNAGKDDRTTLEGQINFLNDVIVDLRNNNELLKKEIEFLKNPYIGDAEFSQDTTTRIKSSAPRLYCKYKNSFLLIIYFIFYLFR